MTLRRTGLAIALALACASGARPPDEPARRMEADPAYCTADADCVCGGVDRRTGECFLGNRRYAAKYVDFGRACPDFCSGITGDLVARCVQNRCETVPR